MKMTWLHGDLNPLYVFLIIGTCVLFVGWKSKKSKSGKRDFKIGGFLVAWVIFIVLSVLFYLLTRIAMNHLK
jgi:arginine exporter protein ArgO